MSASNTRQTESSPLKLRIASNLRLAQEGKGLSNQAAADAVGAHVRLYAKWRAGTVTPSSRYLSALADLLTDGDVSWFFVDRPESSVSTGRAA
jgi:transcriptional regulator with XRE-family HTH domain